MDQHLEVEGRSSFWLVGLTIGRGCYRVKRSRFAWLLPYATFVMKMVFNTGQCAPEGVLTRFGACVEQALG